MTAFIFGGAEAVCRITEPPPAEAMAEESFTEWIDWDEEFFTARGWNPARDYNSDGLRDRQRAVAKLPGTRRLMCLGDSTTYGFHLKPEQAYPQLLQTSLDARGGGVEVFNVALPGWSARQELIAYRRICRKYGPDQLLLGVCLNDIIDMQNNLGRPPPVISWLYRCSALVRRAVDARGREIRSLDELFDPEPSLRVRAGYERLFADLRVLRMEAADDGIGLALLVLPLRSQVVAGAPRPRPQETIATFCREERIALVDLLPALRRATRPAFVDEDHLTAVGMQIVADEVLSSGLLDHLIPAQTLPTLDASSLSALRRALDDPAPAVRAAAASALERAGARAQPIGPALVARLRDTDENVRLRAADALVAIGPNPDSLPQLVLLLEDEAAPVRAVAARVVAAMGPAGRDAVASLAAALEKPGEDARAAAALALGQIGPDARAAVPRLVGLIAHSGDTRIRAVEALGLIRDPRAAAALCHALGDASGDVRWQAARALGRVGPAAHSCAPALLLALDDANADVRMAAVRALPKLGVEPGRILPALERLRDDPSGEVRAEAGRAVRALKSH